MRLNEHKHQEKFGFLLCFVFKKGKTTACLSIIKTKQRGKPTMQERKARFVGAMLFECSDSEDDLPGFMCKHVLLYP